ncbi:MAG: response regulator [Gammaproteobacteria bacterium]|nr:response regulator [Gammaproteobacteria bacterium]
MKKILLVDDEPHVIKVLKIFLDKNGYQVAVAHNGEQAMASINNQMPDIVITDIQMPKMTGQELCEKIAIQYKDSAPHLIIMTSRTDAQLREWAEQNSGIEFLEKPLSPRKLVNHLRQLFEEMEEVSVPA